jgi:hypothetical protein
MDQAPWQSASEDHNGEGRDVVFKSRHLSVSREAQLFNSLKRSTSTDVGLSGAGRAHPGIAREARLCSRECPFVPMAAAQSWAVSDADGGLTYVRAGREFGRITATPAPSGQGWQHNWEFAIDRVALLTWMAVEIAIVGYSNNPPLQPFYVLLGAVITGVGLGWRVTLGPETPRAT